CTTIRASSWATTVTLPLVLRTARVGVSPASYDRSQTSDALARPACPATMRSHPADRSRGTPNADTLNVVSVERRRREAMSLWYGGDRWRFHQACSTRALDADAVVGPSMCRWYDIATLSRERTRQFCR